MVTKNKERPQKRKNLVPPKQLRQLKLDIFPSEFQTAPPRENKQIVINKIDSVTKYDEIALIVEFKLIPSKIEFSKVKSTIWFDDQEVKSDLIRIPQGFGILDEFQLKSELDMRGISTGAHIIKVELHDLYSSCAGIKEKTVEYLPLYRKASYRKIPIAKKIACCDFTVISDSEKKIYQEIEKTKKKELISNQDKW
jgi:hypothetical protein